MNADDSNETPVFAIGVRLSIMMALQYGIMGSWWVLISQYLLSTLKYSPTQAASARHAAE